MISNYFLNWWYSPSTKLGIYFTGFSTTPTNQLQLSSQSSSGIDKDNGLSASIEENLILENRISDYPVQGGSVVTDNIIKMPKTLQLTGYLTSLKSLVLLGYLDFNQLGSAVESLINAYENKLGITVVTGLLFGKTYLKLDNMVIQRLEIPRNNAVGKTAIRFNLTLRQVLLDDLPIGAGNSFSSSQPYNGALPS
jgi:hypothetical protein